MAILLYFDTNVLCRPFDDQTVGSIRREAEAFERILEKIKDGVATFVASEILLFEIQRIISPTKRAKVSGYLRLSRGYYVATEGTFTLAKEIMGKFRLQPRDALHAASALLTEAEYFLSCDDGVTRRFKKRPLSVNIQGQERLTEVMNPEDFIEKTGW